jgi:sulfoxide reductase heme-binding subunit YedZ
MPSARRIAIVLLSLPALLLTVDAALDRLGANPAEAIQNRLGWWAHVWLIATLACSPLTMLTGQGAFVRQRRLFGLAAFAYALLHLASWALLDHALDLDEMWDDVVDRRFLLVGLAAFTLLVPLAVTSTDGWLRRLGGSRWRALHRLVFAAVPLVVLHHLWRDKVITAEPLLFAGLAALLVGVRIVRRVRARGGSPATSRRC